MPLLTLMQGMGRQEGILLVGSRPYKNNNPGDLEYHDWMIPYNAKPEAHPTGIHVFAQFPTVTDGYNCMRALLMHPAVYKGSGTSRRLLTGYLGATILDALNEWAPSGENNVNVYANAVKQFTGLSNTTIITKELLA